MMRESPINQRWSNIKYLSIWYQQFCSFNFYSTIESCERAWEGSVCGDIKKILQLWIWVTELEVHWVKLYNYYSLSNEPKVWRVCHHPFWQHSWLRKASLKKHHSCLATGKLTDVHHRRTDWCHQTTHCIRGSWRSPMMYHVNSLVTYSAENLCLYLERRFIEWCSCVYSLLAMLPRISFEDDVMEASPRDSNGTNNFLSLTNRWSTLSIRDISKPEWSLFNACDYFSLSAVGRRVFRHDYRIDSIDAWAWVNPPSAVNVLCEWEWVAGGKWCHTASVADFSWHADERDGGWKQCSPGSLVFFVSFVQEWRVLIERREYNTIET